MKYRRRLDSDVQQLRKKIERLADGQKSLTLDELVGIQADIESLIDEIKRRRAWWKFWRKR